ncbi:MAG: hypothetical protein GX624_07635 [Actinobacteria bacterium]|mgnify:CR=1|nr:hypothetical protein [Actinomycetota bacterium]
MSRTTVLIVAVVATLVAVVVVFAAWRPFAEDDTVRTRALGVWEESASTNPVRMTVSSRDSAANGDDDAEYWVTYPRMSDTPFPARLEGERIQVFDAEQREALWSIVYDSGADALIVTQPGGGDSFVLRRISE